MANENGKSETPTREYASLDYEYNALMSSLHVSVSKHLLNDKFTVIWANDYYYEMTGYTKEEYDTIFHCNCGEYFQKDPEEYAKISMAVEKAYSAGLPGYEQICRMPQKNGGYIWIRFVGTFTKETIDGIPVIYVVYTNINDLIQTQVEQSVTYENLPGFVAKFRITKDQKFKFIYANEKFIRFFGKRKENDPPYSFVNLDIESNRKVVRDNFSAMRRGETVRFVVRGKDKSGNDAWLQVNAECIDWLKKDPIYLVIYIDITDITEQRELQKKLEERSELLRNALDMAEKANHAKSEFLSRMSHDIRTPMNGIMGLVTVAEEMKGVPDPVRECLNKIKVSAKFLLSLINDILDMSKIENGKTILKKNRFDFSVFVQSIATMFYAQAQRKGVHFNIHLGYGLQDAYFGDELKLNQILNNLLDNAIKFTNPGGNVDFSIVRGGQDQKSTELIFTVKDNGMGMSEGFLAKVFQPFEQDDRQGIQREGSGLGLAIAGNYAKLMNGTIEIESRVGQGSTFVAHVWVENVINDSPKEQYLNFQRVLIVDDDTASSRYTSSLLERFGIWADVCELEAFLTEKTEKPIQIVILDLESIKESQLPTVKSICEAYQKKSAIVAVATFDRSKMMDSAFVPGAYFLQKPLFATTINDFLSIISENPSLQEEKNIKELFSGEKIMLVEDNDINLEIAQTLLESRGLVVETARNGKEAVALFQERGPAYYFVILMDIQMPVMNGLEATAAIRKSGQKDAQTVPIIAMSANAFDDDVEKSLEAGMNLHVSKPFDIEVLCGILKGLERPL